MEWEDASEVNDYAGDYFEGSEGIQEGVEIDIRERVEKNMESCGEEGVEALENGDYEGAIDRNNDISEEKKVEAKEILNIAIGKHGMRVYVDADKVEEGGGKLAKGIALTMVAQVVQIPVIREGIGIPGGKMTIEGALELVDGINVEFYSLTKELIPTGENVVRS